MTDEIFGVAASRKGEVHRSYFGGLVTLPVIGWVFGTFAGAVLGGVLPPLLQSAMGNCYLRNVFWRSSSHRRDDLRYLRVIVIAVVLSCCFRYMPVFDQVSSGFAIIICAVVASAIGAVLYPIDEEGGEEA